MLETCPHCQTTVLPNKDRTCPQCLGNFDGGPAPTQVPHGLVSKVCPKCGGMTHRKLKPDRLIAFTSDRICDKCGIRYVPPTPRWAAIVFIVIGLLFVVGSLMDTVVHVLNGQWLLVVWKLLLAVFGMALLTHGFRSLFLARAAR